MGWTKILDDHDAGAIDTDFLHVGGRDWATVAIEGTLGGNTCTVMGTTYVPDSSSPPVFTRTEFTAYLIDIAAGAPASIVLSTTGIYRVPCPGETMFLRLAGGTSTNLNIWAI
jgi:hypothetical protein